MKPMPQQLRSKLKRQALLDAALYEFSENSYETTTSKTIAKRANVAVGTFYQHFSSKGELLTAIASQRYDDLYTKIINFDMSDIPSLTLAKDVRIRLLNVLNIIYDFHALHPDFHAVIEQRRHSEPELEDIVSKGEDVLLDRVKKFVDLFNVADRDQTAFTIFAMIEGVIHRHVFYPTDVKKEQVLNILGDCLGTYLVSLRVPKPSGA